MVLDIVPQSFPWSIHCFQHFIYQYDMDLRTCFLLPQASSFFSVLILRNQRVSWFFWYYTKVCFIVNQSSIIPQISSSEPTVDYVSCHPMERGTKRNQPWVPTMHSFELQLTILNYSLLQFFLLGLFSAYEFSIVSYQTSKAFVNYIKQ